MLSKLAHDCQTVVITRTRVIGAASVIQRAWRLFWAQKMNRAAITLVARNGDDHNDEESVTMQRARTQGAAVRSESVVKALETAEVDIWLL